MVKREGGTGGRRRLPREPVLALWRDGKLTQGQIAAHFRTTTFVHREGGV